MCISTYWKYEKWHKNYAHGKSNTSKVLKHIVEICRNKNIMKVVFNLKEKNYKYE